MAPAATFPNHRGHHSTSSSSGERCFLRFFAQLPCLRLHRFGTRPVCVVLAQLALLGSLPLVCVGSVHGAGPAGSWVDRHRVEARAEKAGLLVCCSWTCLSLFVPRFCGVSMLPVSARRIAAYIYVRTYTARVRPPRTSSVCLGPKKVIITARPTSMRERSTTYYIMESMCHLTLDFLGYCTLSQILKMRRLLFPNAATKSLVSILRNGL